MVGFLNDFGLQIPNVIVFLVSVVQNYSKTRPKSLGFKWFGRHLVFGPFAYWTTKSPVFKGSVFRFSLFKTRLL